MHRVIGERSVSEVGVDAETAADIPLDMVLARAFDSVYADLPPRLREQRGEMGDWIADGRSLGTRSSHTAGQKYVNSGWPRGPKSRG